jgi:hypothetical protein
MLSQDESEPFILRLFMRTVRHFRASCGRVISSQQRATRKIQTRSIFCFFVVSASHAQIALDTIVFGDNASETKGPVCRPVFQEFSSNCDSNRNCDFLWCLIE